MNNLYVVIWQNKNNLENWGHGKPMSYVRAARHAGEGNRKYPFIKHWTEHVDHLKKTVDAMKKSIKQAV